MEDLKRLQQILAQSVVGLVLPVIAEQNLPDWWLAGGAVRNTVWKALFGAECHLTIKDFDIAFFDAAGDRAQELAAKTALAQQFPDYQFDVKNQASFGRWRPGDRLYHSSEDGISQWLHTATAVGVRCDRQGQWQFFTPYGLEDLFQGLVCPTPTHRQNPKAESKAAEFLQACSALRLKDESTAINPT